MDRTKMLQVLGPAGGAALVVLLIAALIAWNNAPPSAANPRHEGPPQPPASASTPPPKGDDAGMSDALPPKDAPEWKPGPGEMRVWDVKIGEGDECNVGATVTIHYTGWTLDGAIFDSSRTRGEATTFSLGSLIKGWQEGIPGMKPGGIRRLEIPYQWAYGEHGSPPKIPAKATLVFEVKLIAAK